MEFASVQWAIKVEERGVVTATVFLWSSTNVAAWLYDTTLRLALVPRVLVHRLQVSAR